MSTTEFCCTEPVRSKVPFLNTIKKKKKKILIVSNRVKNTSSININGILQRKYSPTIIGNKCTNHLRLRLKRFRSTIIIQVIHYNIGIPTDWFKSMNNFKIKMTHSE